MSSEVVSFVTITPKAEFFGQCRDAVLKIVDRTRAEAGCSEFTLHESAEPDGNLYLYEIFADQAAIDYHMDRSFVQEIMGQYAEWLAQPIALVPLTRLGD